MPSSSKAIELAARCPPDPCSKGAPNNPASPAADHGRTLTCLVQLDLDEGPHPAGRGGAAPGQLPELAAAVEQAGSLVLGGVMCIAPLGADPDRAFARLARLAAELRSSYPQATMISAGMSGDLEAAVAHGATHLRVGTALLGSRPPLG